MPALTERFPWLRRPGTRLAFVVGLLLVAGAVGWLVLRPAAPSAGQAITDGPAVRLTPRLIDGVPDTEAHRNLVPVAVVVQNITEARPQEGLERASVVYETWAEGGITRFLAVFVLSDDLERIGPIRSARPYFAEWAKEYQGLFVHAGGSPQAFARIQALELLDWDEFAHGSSFFRYSARSKTREHTLFSSSERLRQALADAGAPREGAFTPWQFQPDPPLAERGSVTELTIDFSTPSYQARYVYDSATNTYQRFHGTEPHRMANGVQIAPKNVVVLRVATSLFDEKRVNIETTGEGDAILFRDGRALPGRWQKSMPEDRLRLIDATGNEMAFNAGQTWIEAVPIQQHVTY